MEILIGLPSLSRGPLLNMAIELGAPVMVSASALAKWEDQGPVPPGYEFTPIERLIRDQKGDTRPPTPAQSKRRMRAWNGWNTAALDRLEGLALRVHLDSAGFVAMARWGGVIWTPESYIEGLAAHPIFERFSSMDLCVEVEVAGSRAEADERIARTINLNKQCHRLAKGIGALDRLMPVIQGVTPRDYVACFHEISHLVPKGSVIGIGSMCRRPTGGDLGSIAVLEALDRHLPKDVRFHLFGIKSSGAEAALMWGDRVASIDSQSYGVRARQIANEKRATDPTFSKTNIFTAGVLKDWYHRQVERISTPKQFAVQPAMDLSTADQPSTVLDAIEMAVRAQFNDFIISGALDHDQIIGGRMLEESVLEIIPDLPAGVRALDCWTGLDQLPVEIVEADWFPQSLAA